MEPLIPVSELLERLGDPGLRVLDARFELLDPAAGERLYRAGHVPDAAFIDLDRHLAAPPERHGGRHPLPDLDAFARAMEERGVGDGHEVVVYDQGGTFFAARAWWLLRYVGHDAVRVLDGGWAAYVAAGGAVSRDVPSTPPAEFRVRLRPEMAADRDEIRAHLGDPSWCLVDVRAPERYRGETEPIDPVAGHIPHAQNRPYTATMDAQGRFLTADALREHYRGVAGRDTVVAYCGSGVSAAHAVLAMEVAGHGGARLYPGSWSDWCSYDDLPVAVGDEGPG